MKTRERGSKPQWCHGWRERNVISSFRRHAFSPFPGSVKYVARYICLQQDSLSIACHSVLTKGKYEDWGESRLCNFFKLKICGNLESTKLIDTIFSKSICSPCVSVSHFEIKPWAFGVGALTPRPWTTRELTLGSIKYWELTQRKPLEYKTQHHPTTSSTLYRKPHLNNKQNKIQTQSSADRITTSLSLAHQRENKWTNKQTKTTQISPYMKLTQTTGPTLAGQKPKGGKNSTFFKERLQVSLKPEKRRPQTQ